MGWVTWQGLVVASWSVYAVDGTMRSNPPTCYRRTKKASQHRLWLQKATRRYRDDTEILRSFQRSPAMPSATSSVQTAQLANGIEAVTLANDQIKVTVLANKGADIYELIHLPSR